MTSQNISEYQRPLAVSHSRREFLYGLGSSLGSLALTDLLAAESPLAVKKPQLPAKAKACIMLFMEGGRARWTHSIPNPD